MHTKKLFRAFMIMLAAFVSKIEAGPTVYSLTSLDTRLVQFDPRTLMSGSNLDSSVWAQYDLAWDASTGRLFGIGADSLVEFDPLKGTIVHSSSYTGSIYGIAARNGKVYAMTGLDNSLVQFDTDTLRPLAAGALPSAYSHYDLAFDERGRLFGLGFGTTSYALLEFDPVTGTILNSREYAGSLAGIAAHNGRLYATTGSDSSILQFDINSLLLVSGVLTNTSNFDSELAFNDFGQLFGTDSQSVRQYDASSGAILNQQTLVGSINGLATGDPLVNVQITLNARAANWYGNGALGNFTMTIENGGSATVHDTRTAGDGSDGRHIAIANRGNATLTFWDQSSAGAMTISNDGAGAQTLFLDNSSAGTALIATGNGGVTRLDGAGVSAASATFLTTAGGRVEFRNDASGANATFVTDVGSVVDIAPNSQRTFTAASIAGAGTFNLGGNRFILGINGGDVIFAGKLNDSSDTGGSGATLVWASTGTLMLSGANSVGVEVQKGTLSLHGASIGQTAVHSGSWLAGNGTVKGNLENAGTVAPDFSLGALVVEGNYHQVPGGTLNLEISSAAHEQLVVKGNAVLDGTLSLTALAGYQWQPGSYVQLIDAGSIQGKFSQITGFIPTPSSAALRFQVLYSANQVSAGLDQIPFSSFVSTANGVRLANASMSNAALTTKLDLIPGDAALTRALQSLSPQDFEIWAPLASNSNVLLSSRLAPMQDAGLQAEVTDRSGTIAGSVDRVAADFRTNGILLQGNRAIRTDLTAGAFVRYDQTDARFGATGKSDIKSYGAGARMGWKSDTIGVSAAAGYNRNNYDSQRLVTVQGDATARSSTQGSDWFTDAKLSWTYRRGAWTFAPYTGLTATHWQSDSFTESGAADANVTMAGQSVTSLISQAGTELTHAWKGARSHGEFQIHGAWLHEWSNPDRDLNGAFGNAPFDLRTTALGRESALLGAGFSIELHPGSTLYADVDLRTGDIKVRPDWHLGVAIGF